VDLVCDLHETLMGSVRGGEERPGELREVPVYIGARDGTPEDANFIPANPDLVPLLLDQLAFPYVGRGEYPPLIDVALTHYQFETIHLPGRQRPDGAAAHHAPAVRLGPAAGPLPLSLGVLQALRRPVPREAPGGEPGGRLGGEWITFVLDAIAEQAIDGYDCGIELTELPGVLPRAVS